MKNREALISSLRGCLPARDGTGLAALATSVSPEDVAVALRGLSDEDVETVLSLLRLGEPELAGEILLVMKRLADEGMTMLVVTHEMGFAAEVADRVLFIDHGHIVERGPADEVLSRPQNPRTRAFLRAVLERAPMDEDDESLEES